ncbi:MAG TPA: hypothetical protein VJ844_04040, partial [Mucilaginibacter sp.]|nr:hypothetical protein [Mucilaginibacter sp.]
MKILISKDAAIRRLSDRYNELRSIRYHQFEAWRSRAVADIHDIFPVLDHRYNELSSLFFPTQDVGDFFQKSHTTALGLLSGYIGYIRDNIPNPQPPAPPRQYEIELKQQQEINFSLQNKIKQLEPLLGQLSQALATKDKEIEQLKANIFQTENINAIRLWRLLINLPGSVQITLGTALFTLLSIGFALG